MIEYQNKLMEDSRKKISRLNELKVTSTASNFLWILWPEFIEYYGCVVRKNPNKDYSHITEDIVKNAAYMDGSYTNYEASINEFRIEDYLDGSYDEYNNRAKRYNPLEGLAIALKAADMWAIKLKNEFPKCNFYIIIAYNKEEMETIIRFHVKRENEYCWVVLDKLENYKSDAVYVREV